MELNELMNGLTKVFGEQENKIKSQDELVSHLREIILTLKSEKNVLDGRIMELESKWASVTKLMKVIQK